MTGETRSDGAETRRAQWLKGLADLALLSLLAERAHYGLEILDRLLADAGIEVAESPADMGAALVRAIGRRA